MNVDIDNDLGGENSYLVSEIGEGVYREGNGFVK